jgi:hypothetical protein
MTMGETGVIDSNMATLRLLGYSEKSDILGLQKTLDGSNARHNWRVQQRG